MWQATLQPLFYILLYRSEEPVDTKMDISTGHVVLVGYILSFSVYLVCNYIK